MTDSFSQAEDGHPRDDACWAEPVSKLKVGRMPTGALNLNVEGRQVVGPLQGFGQMWQKIFKVRLAGTAIESTEVIKTWKEHFSTFWPKESRFFAPLTGIAPGEVALINAVLPGGLPLPVSTGMLVIYADEECFTLMTPQGHPVAAWITFSAYEEDGYTVAQVEQLLRTDDPIYEVGFRLLGTKGEDKFWQDTLASLASYFGILGEPVQMYKTCIDPRVQWSEAGNVWQNAVIRTVFYKMASPVLWVRKRLSPTPRPRGEGD
jgi:hypothetical protein